jgi:4-hydroxy-tetrahydrodipicolinate reductase
MIRLLVHGATGRLGRVILEVAKTEPNFTVTGATREDSPEKLVDATDVVVDVSAAAATVKLAQICAEAKKPLVVGTTGHNQAQLEALRQASTQCPLMLAPNFSVGVNLLYWLAELTAKALGENFDVEIIEWHHRLKKDAPSGTAKKLAETIAVARRLSYEQHARHGRAGAVGERSRDEIGMHAIRGGDIVGEHTVLFAGPGERIELTHKASSRETFARGALRAASWIVERAPGLYEMRDTLEESVKNKER